MPCWFPARLHWVEFRTVLWETDKAKGLFVSSQERIYKLSFVTRGAIDEQTNPPPPFQQLLEESDKIPLILPSGKRKHECAFDSGAEHACVFVLEVLRCGGVATPPRPAAHYMRDEPKCGFVLGRYYEAPLLEIFRQHSSFFLKRAIVTFDGAL